MEEKQCSDRLSFLACARKGADIIAKKYPSHKFLTLAAVGSTKNGKPAPEPKDIDQLTLFCVFHNDPSIGTVKISTTKWGEFGDVEKAAIIGDDPFDLSSINMSLEKANELKNKAGYSSPYIRAGLSRPVVQTATNVFYMFELYPMNLGWVFVDSVTGKVTHYVPSINKKQPKEILSFDGRINIAVRIVTETFPKAVLYEADGVSTDGPTTDPVKINKLRCVFGTAGKNEHYIITETKRGEFGPIHVYKHGWYGDIVIKWPGNYIGLKKANALKIEAGYDEPYSAVKLRNPFVGPIINPNPFYIFGSSPGPFIFVDAVTGKIPNYKSQK